MSSIRSTSNKHTLKASNTLNQWRYTSRVEKVSMWPLPWIHGPTNWRRKAPNVTKLCTQAKEDRGSQNRLKIDDKHARVPLDDPKPCRPMCGSLKTDLGAFPLTLGSSLTRRCTKLVHPSIVWHQSRSVDSTDLWTDLLACLQVPHPLLGTINRGAWLTLKTHKLEYKIKAQVKPCLCSSVENRERVWRSEPSPACISADACLLLVGYI